MPQLDVVSFCNQVTWLSLFIITIYALFAYFVTKPYNKVMQLQSYFLRTYKFSFYKNLKKNLNSRSFIFISVILEDLNISCTGNKVFTSIRQYTLVPFNKLILKFSNCLKFIGKSNTLFFYIHKVTKK